METVYRLHAPDHGITDVDFSNGTQSPINALPCDFCGVKDSPYLLLGEGFGLAFCSDDCRTTWIDLNQNET
jgi:hypothetical protein